jgi:hypothetical protein
MFCICGRSVTSGCHKDAQYSAVGRTVTEERVLCVKWDGQIVGEGES